MILAKPLRHRCPRPCERVQPGRKFALHSSVLAALDLYEDQMRASGIELATELKSCEAQVAIVGGAQEIDMVINIGLLKSGDQNEVRRDIEAVTGLCRTMNAVSKIIVETALLNDEQQGAGRVQAARKNGDRGVCKMQCFRTALRQNNGPYQGQRRQSGMSCRPNRRIVCRLIDANEETGKAEAGKHCPEETFGTTDNRVRA